MINVGIIGYGYWGPNIARNFNAIEGARLISICDTRPEVLKGVQKTYPSVQITADYRDIVNSPHIDAVAIVTPVSSHYDLSKKSLENGKHIFVEKPFTSTVGQAEKSYHLRQSRRLETLRAPQRG